MKKIFRPVMVMLTACAASFQAQQIQNAQVLQPFTEKLSLDRISNILFIGDSHIQADWLTSYLRQKFQSRYGNAGRGLVFPYQLGNTNGADDFSSASNSAWETFRLVHEQDVFPQLGASGFVIGNKEKSFIEIQFKNPEDTFDSVVIYNDAAMSGKPFTIYSETEPLSRFVQKKTEKLSHTAVSGETFHEIVSKYNTTTTRLRQLNGDRILQPVAGNTYKVERNYPVYNAEFENKIQQLKQYTFTGSETEVDFSSPQQVFLMQTDVPKGNLFYGFRFLKNVKKGIVFNTVGVNGATYGDFLKYPLQVQQLVTLAPDVLIIALGTNEIFSNKITKEEFQANVSTLISKFRAADPRLPVLLIGPPDNQPKEARIPEIISWLQESAEKNNAAFFDLYQAAGGKGYFKKALMKKEAASDGVHYLRPGYENQAELIWKAISSVPGSPGH